MKSALLAVFLVFAVSCVGTTGGDLVDFQAAAAGPPDAVAGEPLSFSLARGWRVELTTARMHIGALYLSDNFPISGAQGTSCILPGSYVAQVTEGRDIDLLSGKPQLFPVLGHGSTLEALAGQVWLTGGDVNVVGDPPQPTVVLEVAGNARQGQLNVPFAGQVTIADNRITTGSAVPGADPICVARIVTPIRTAVRIETQGALLLRIDPRLLFTNVDFNQLPPADDTGSRSFTDAKSATDQPSINLYNNLKQAGPLYDFSWVPSLN